MTGLRLECELWKDSWHRGKFPRQFSSYEILYFANPIHCTTYLTLSYEFIHCELVSVKKSSVDDAYFWKPKCAPLKHCVQVAYLEEFRVDLEQLEASRDSLPFRAERVDHTNIILLIIPSDLWIPQYVGQSKRLDQKRIVFSPWPG